MVRTCTICTHHRRHAMDKVLLRGEQLKAVARRYGVSDDALGRHRKHMRLVIAKAAAQVEQKDVGIKLFQLPFLSVELKGNGTLFLSGKRR